MGHIARVCQSLPCAHSLAPVAEQLTFVVFTLGWSVGFSLEFYVLVKVIVLHFLKLPLGSVLLGDNRFLGVFETD